MAAPGSPAPSDDVLRAALKRAQERGVSLRRLGAELKLSAAGVLKLVNGSRPRAATRKRLLEWYFGQPALENEPTWPAAEPMFAALLAGLPPDGLRRVVAGAARLAAEEFARVRTPAPAWVAHVRGDRAP